VLYYANQTKEEREGTALLTLTAPSITDPNGTITLVSSLSESGENSSEDVDAFEGIGMYLHRFLLPRFIKSSIYHSYSNVESTIDELEHSDDSPMRRFLHAISTGSVFKQRADDESRKSSLEQREYNATYVASELIHSAKGGGYRQSPLKNAISDFCLCMNASNAMVNMLSSFNLSRSRPNLAITSDQAVNETLKTGWNPKGRGFGILQGMYDNIGYRRKIGYKQFTLLAMSYYPVEYLICLGIYPDPAKNPEEAYSDPKYLSNEGHLWEEVKDDYHFSITKEDANLMLSEVTLPCIQYVLDAKSDGSLPTLAQAKEFITSVTSTATFEKQIPTSATKRRSMRTDAPDNGDVTSSVVAHDVRDEDCNDIDNDLDEDFLQTDDDTEGDVDMEGGNDAGGGVQTILKNNHVTVDAPLEGDLNTTRVVMGIMDYYADITQRCLEQTNGCNNDSTHMPDDTDGDAYKSYIDGNPWAKAGWDHKYWPKPWMKSNGNVLSGDRNPTYAALKLKRLLERYKVQRMTVMNGGFHTMLELHKMRGRMFGPTHKQQIWKKWRPSEAQWKWVENPGDPNQVDDELIMYYMGLIDAAIDALLEMRGGTDGISAVEVLKFCWRLLKLLHCTALFFLRLEWPKQCSFSTRRKKNPTPRSLFVHSSLLHHYSQQTMQQNIRISVLIC
jgi:hypothetical protein